MLARALIVLLLILNLGVVLWWITREVPPPAAGITLPPGAEPLRLLDESTRPAAVAASSPPAAATPDPAPAVAEPVAPPSEEAPAAPAVASTCHAFGPFADAAAAGQARAQLQPVVQRLSTRESRSAPRGWSVHLPALTDRAAAAAMVTRLVEAGFRDHYLMPAAENGAVDIALGRFGSEPAAQRHRAALREAGFEAVAEPIGEAGDVRYWIDVAVGEYADLAVLQRAAGAAQAERIDCATLAAAAR
ncbi:hypothetical protein FQY83_15120 [Luteimonas marina]|uniref:SPOR domain-containing protein n=1 Tax=Luteimonas marina TaxID=488485 RepID=A0A5C5TYV5_9GAMM|nr:SPOR domain-containing protein [Luteimonas marina]TWT18699.1 hypothetical protein FQY83_15120 [Luteimonas marina]